MAKIKATKIVTPWNDPAEIADRLWKIRDEISAYAEVFKNLKEKEEKLRDEMLLSLREMRLESYRNEQVPLTFTRTRKSSVEVTDKDRALAWAVAHDCAKVDTIAANKALTGAGALPEGFGHKETESIMVRVVE